jgi:hypothetical protein
VAGSSSEKSSKSSEQIYQTTRCHVPKYAIRNSPGEKFIPSEYKSFFNWGHIRIALSSYLSIPEDGNVVCVKDLGREEAPHKWQWT